MSRSWRWTARRRRQRGGSSAGLVGPCLNHGAAVLAAKSLRQPVGRDAQHLPTPWTRCLHDGGHSYRPPSLSPSEFLPLIERGVILSGSRFHRSRKGTPATSEGGTQCKTLQR